jgi:hypothetical protein
VVSENECAATSRRTLLRVAGASATAGVLAGVSACGSGSSARTHTAPISTPAMQVDIQLLNGALDLEYRAIALYTAAVPLLGGRAHAAAKLFLEQELAHASTLISLIGDSNGKPNKQRPSYDFGHPRGRRGLFALLVTLENQQVASYVNAITQLSTGPIRAAIASILANDAQHLSVSLLLLGRNPIPAAFVTGQQ